MNKASTIPIPQQKTADIETLYARAMALYGRYEDVDIKSLLKFELSPFPSAMFSGYGQMRECTNKANLKKKPIKISCLDA